MPITKRRQFTDSAIKQAYEEAGSLSGMAERLNITYPTAATWCGLIIKLVTKSRWKPRSVVWAKK